MKWIDRQQPFEAMIERIGAEPRIAVDTEADSLHSYFDKVCLIQISVPGEDYIVDPLAKIDIAKFGDVLANANITKILHGADYDLRILNRDFGFTVANLIDTMVSAQLLGYEAFGLAALLERHFGLKIDKAHQRADWAMRPLPRDMLDYAANDTRHLAALADKLLGEIDALGRRAWVAEEMARLEAIRYRENDDDTEPFRRLKTLGGLDRRTLAVVRALYDWRDALARNADRPPFKIIGNDALLEIAREKPKSREELAKLKTVSSYHRGRYGNDILRTVREAMALPEDELPEKVESKPWLRDKVLEARVNRLKHVRDAVAAELKVDGSVLAPRHVLTAIATTGDVDQAPAMREWQKRLLAEKFAKALS
jgi:ribonuclease D